MRLFFLFFILILNGCATPDLNTPIVYKMEIQQGNEIDSEMLLKLKPGMTKSQVKFILGTPLIADSFHKDRWDYLYVINTYDSTKNKLGFTERRHVVLNFEKELLNSIETNIRISLKENKKENQTEKIREKVIQEVEVENNMLDTKDSVNEVIRKDISQEKEEERSRVKNNNLREQAESKQDIIDSKSDEPDYFDLMLEKIGF